MRKQGLWTGCELELARRFDAMENPYLRERAAYVRGLGSQVLRRLLGESAAAPSGHGPKVLAGQRSSPLDIGQLQGGHVVAVVCGDGSSLSHAAILARALGIPTMRGVCCLPLAHLEGQELVVDGTAGQVHLRPTAVVRKAFEKSISAERQSTEVLESVRTLDVMTADGDAVALFINAGLSPELNLTAAARSAGIGLFRSELPFIQFDRLTSEPEQLALYLSDLAGGGAPALALLLGMEFDGLSMSAAALPRVKWAVRGTTSAYQRSLTVAAVLAAFDAGAY